MAETPWNKEDIETLTYFYNNNIELSRIAEKLNKSIYSVQYQLSLLGLIEMPIDVTVENSPIGSSVLNSSGAVVYSDKASFKIVRNKILRINRKSMCITIKEIKRVNGEWVKGSKLLVAYSDTELYNALSNTSFLDDIEDFEVNENNEQNKIKVKGSWYDYYGFKMKDQSLLIIFLVSLENDCFAVALRENAGKANKS